MLFLVPRFPSPVHCTCPGEGCEMPYTHARLLAVAPHALPVSELLLLSVVCTGVACNLGHGPAVLVCWRPAHSFT